jgi:hypothetical protein
MIYSALPGEGAQRSAAQRKVIFRLSGVMSQYHYHEDKWASLGTFQQCHVYFLSRKNLPYFTYNFSL